MLWFKWFIITYFIIKSIDLVRKSISHQGRESLTDIIAGFLSALIAFGVYFWL